LELVLYKPRKDTQVRTSPVPNSAKETRRQEHIGTKELKMSSHEGYNICEDLIHLVSSFRGDPNQNLLLLRAELIEEAHLISMSRLSSKE